MKNYFNICRIALTIIVLLSTKSLLAQSYPIGVYVNFLSKTDKLTFYTTNGIHYVVVKKGVYESENGEKKVIESTSGLHRISQDFNYTSGPYATYGQDGYFYRKNGKDYYFDKLLAELVGGYEDNPKDSLQYLYVKESGLPLNWELTPEFRIGELGVVNKNVLYQIIKVDDVYKQNIDGTNNYIYIKGSKYSDEEMKTFLISESDYLRLNISKLGFSDPIKLKGKILQLFFKWESGFYPGYINEDADNVGENKNCIPFEIYNLEISFNSKSLIQFPLPKK